MRALRLLKDLQDIELHLAPYRGIWCRMRALRLLTDLQDVELHLVPHEGVVFVERLTGC